MTPFKEKKVNFLGTITIFPISPHGIVKGMLKSFKCKHPLSNSLLLKFSTKEEEQWKLEPSTS